jgi:GAF domain-containing protein/anti-sigma regulatory factor (Ser/Thr protein kinase)
MRGRAKPRKAKVKARLPVARKPPKTEASGGRDLEKRLAESLEREKAKDRALAEALEQQTATSEILRVISSSPTDAQPVFDTIVRSASELCGGQWAIVVRLDGELLHLAAQHNPRPGLASAAEKLFPRRPGRDLTVGRAVLEGAIVHIPDVTEDLELGHDARGGQIARAFLAVPMLREGVPTGAIGVSRATPGPFVPEQIGLLKTFADQAVIAIENVRLFTELQQKNEALTQAHAQVSESLEQQTATSEILRVISSSPTDARPVFETIVASAGRLCGAESAVVYRFEGGAAHFAAHYNLGPEAVEAYGRRFPRPLHQTDYLWRIADGSVLNSTDIEQDSRMSTAVRADYRSRGARSAVWVPMVREGQALGAISVTHRDIDAFSRERVQLLQTFADQAVIAIENVRLFTELQEKNSALTVAYAQVTEALEQQTATAEILRVISSSPTDVQPVLDAVAESAARLCDAPDVSIFLQEADLLRVAARHGPIPSDTALPLNRESGVGWAVLAGRTIHVADMQTEVDRFPVSVQNARRLGFRTALNVPLIREGVAIGAISLRRAEAHLFAERYVALLETFAAQAVIAIENVRLFTELQASNRELTTALDQQTATSDILRVISRSQTDVQPVFDAIVGSAVRLLGAYSGSLTRVAGDQIELAALTSTDDAGDIALRADFPQPLHSEGGHARVIRDRAPLNIADAQTDPRVRESARAAARARGSRSRVVVPLLRHDAAVGAISVSRREPGEFTDDEIALLKTFADQAVIAIENVRLFTELEGRNRDLTATSEILRVISSSPTDIQPVFDTIVRSAVRLCDGLYGFVSRFDGELIHVAAHHNYTPEGLRALHQMYPIQPGRQLVTGRAILTGAIVHVEDALADPEYAQDFARAGGWRSMLAVPMLRGVSPIGAILVMRAQPGPFPEAQIELLKTFADQAVIAIENVRLFTELQARTAELTRSVHQLTALGEISQAVSSTLDVETVLDTIVSRATELAGADACGIYEYDADAQMFHVRATHNFDAAFVASLRAMPLHKGEGVAGRATEMRQPIQIADIAAPGAYESQVRDLLIGAGYRAALSVPLLREEQIIGSLSLVRKASGEFSSEAVEVLKTFATQSALAIQNARLFREIADKSRQLEVASQHKSEFLANMSHELRTPLNAIIGFSEVLVDRMFGELNEKQDEYLKDIYASGQHLLSLINDILDLSKIEAGRMELEATDFDLPSAIDNALILVRERATRRGITLGRTIDERLGMLRGDERKVKQVLLNLLSNALKFTPEGGRIDVSARLKDGAAEIAVADTGVGIAPEDQEAVFEEFRQVGTADKKVEGTGLGLALSRKFIELHGGRIWVKSQVGHGSTFTFTLPMHREE